jgi:hypothetical protein
VELRYDLTHFLSVLVEAPGQKDLRVHVALHGRLVETVLDGRLPRHHSSTIWSINLEDGVLESQEIAVVEVRVLVGAPFGVTAYTLRPPPMTIARRLLVRCHLSLLPKKLTCQRDARSADPRRRAERFPHVVIAARMHSGQRLIIG